MLAGYVYIEDKAKFIVHDPLPQNVGEVYLLSYEELCHQIIAGSEWSAYWWGALVVNTHYADETITWYLD